MKDIGETWIAKGAGGASEPGVYHAAAAKNL
jgi:hypothetical protein